MEDAVRFYDRLTEEDLQKTEYNEILFRGQRVLDQREEDFKNLMISSSFSAWQISSARGDIKMDWKTYLKKLNLVDDKEEEIAPGQIQKDFVDAVSKSQQMIERYKQMSQKG